MRNYDEELKKLTEAARAFKMFVDEIDEKVSSFIESKNNAKSLYPTSSHDHFCKVYATPIPMTKKQKDCLLSYLNRNYIQQLYGDCFEIRAAWFDKRYLIETRFFDRGWDD